MFGDAPGLSLVQNSDRIDALASPKAGLVIGGFGARETGGTGKTVVRVSKGWGKEMLQ